MLKCLFDGVAFLAMAKFILVLYWHIGIEILLIMVFVRETDILLPGKREIQSASRKIQRQ